MKSVGKSLLIYYAASVVLIMVLLSVVTSSFLSDPAVFKDQFAWEHLAVRWAACEIPIAMVVTIVSAVSFRRASSPIKSISEQLAMLSSGASAAKVELVETDQSYQVLVAEVNRLAQSSRLVREQLHQFSAKVAHELRAPIALLQLQIDYASQDLNPELADSLKGQINRLSEYVETALLVARAERGNVPIKKEMLAVNEFFSELLEPYKLRAKRHRRDLVSNLSSTRKAKIDPKIVALIFNNLLSNAFYHGSGKIRIRIKDNTSSTLLSITNYVRDGVITNYLEGGTGMGLETVQTLASVHGDLQVTTYQRNRIYGAAIRILHTSVSRDSLSPMH